MKEQFEREENGSNIGLPKSSLSEDDKLALQTCLDDEPVNIKEDEVPKKHHQVFGFNIKEAMFKYIEPSYPLKTITKEDIKNIKDRYGVCTYGREKLGVQFAVDLTSDELRKEAFRLSNPCNNKVLNARLNDQEKLDLIRLVGPSHSDEEKLKAYDRIILSYGYNPSKIPSEKCIETEGELRDANEKFLAERVTSKRAKKWGDFTQPQEKHTHGARYFKNKDTGVILKNNTAFANNPLYTECDFFGDYLPQETVKISKDGNGKYSWTLFTDNNTTLLAKSPETYDTKEECEDSADVFIFATGSKIKIK